MSEPAPKNDIVRSLINVALVDGACIALGVVLFLFTNNIIWLIAGILIGAVLSVPALLKVFRTARK
ncbi:MAG: hypothetical protein AAGJ85_06450 [Pseudomonadota bacterium]